jgi:predicted DNA-binding transcriptional regulator AlpA
MTPKAKAARDGRSSDTLTGAGMFADPVSRLRSADHGTPRQTAHTRRRRAAQREAGPLPENALLTVGQLCAEQHISRSTFYDWRAKGTAPQCIVLPNGSLRAQRADLAQWLSARRAACAAARSPRARFVRPRGKVALMGASQPGGDTHHKRQAR